MALTIFIAVLVVILIAFYVMYAGIIRNKNNALEALSGIDVQLKARSNLIPNILTIAKKFMEHEKELLENVTKLRTRESEGYDSSTPHRSKHIFQRHPLWDQNSAK